MKAFSKKWFLILGIPLVSAIGLSVLASGGRHGLMAFDGGHCFMKPDRIAQIIDWKLNDFMDEIDATADQREKVMAEVDALIGEAKAMHSDMQDPHRVLLEQWKSDSPDMSIIQKHLDEGAAMKKAFAGKIAEALLEIHDILTPEQRDKVASHIEDHMAMFHEFLK